MQLVARVVSIVFHPLLLATYLFSVFAWLYPPALFPITERSFSGILLLVFITTFVLPAVNVYFFKAFGTISSLSMPLRKERIVPFLMISFLYALVTYLLYAKTGLNWQDPFMRFLLIINTLVMSSFLITLFVKASIHALSMAAVTVMIIMLNNLVENGIFFYPMLTSLILCGLIMTARLYLQVHTVSEVITGAFIGVVVAFVGMTYLF